MITRQRSKLVLSGAVVWVLLLLLPAARAAGPPDFQEVYDLLKANLPGMEESALQRAAVDGLIANLGGRVSIVGASASPSTNSSKDPVLARVVEDRFAYLRLSAPDAATSLVEQALTQLASTNRLQGGVVDLRFAKGRDFAAAGNLASLWVSSSKPLLDWGTGPVNGGGKNPAGKIPWVVLVNGETAGSAEALAAILRQTETALVVGSRTAGQAATTREFTLKNGQRLQIASQPIKLGDGKELSGAAVVPDIEVRVELEAERSAMRDFESGSSRSVAESSRKGSAASAGNSKAARRRINEAELVRLQREGKRTDQESVTSGTNSPETSLPESSFLPQDAALSRAVDLLKGLAVVRQTKGG